jgi:predicted  nucleic acid-binding Zn-ribbon protein
VLKHYSYQTSITIKQLLAKHKIASKDLYTALISLTDSKSSYCFKDAEILISKIEKNIPQFRKRIQRHKELISKEFEERKLRYQTEEAIESSRINAIRNRYVLLPKQKSKDSHVLILSGK